MNYILAYIDAVTAVRAFYLLSVSAILLVRLIPPLGDRFLQYGARQTAQSGGQGTTPLLTRQLDQVAAFRVPHSTFWHFYALSIVCTSLCIVAVVSRSSVLILLLWGLEHGDSLDSSNSSSSNSSSSNSSSNSSNQVSSLARVVLCLSLLWCQGVRRLWECISLPRGKPSTSSMWIGHYLIGMAFYVFANLGIVVEHLHSLSVLNQVADEGSVSLGGGRSLVRTAAFVGFVAASWKQHAYHVYLASLKKYTLPTEGAFNLIVAPHYTAECAIYLALALLSAPIDGMFNVTILCALAFVIVNLGTTADGTKRWMVVKFSESRVEIEKRWRMIPGMF